MTLEIEPDASDRTEQIAEELHEHAVNEIDFDTDDVLVVAHDDDSVTSSIIANVPGGKHGV
ncbi:hypothetical protein [Halosegnis longus]|uniref:hypothetical protein n=1 Tax=Halosegnis longus TaxID=2216012 RepID=UPI00129EF351|nr:hypothetical protein [Halosegnis longus]